MYLRWQHIGHAAEGREYKFDDVSVNSREMFSVEPLCNADCRTHSSGGSQHGVWYWNVIASRQ